MSSIGQAASYPPHGSIMESYARNAQKDFLRDQSRKLVQEAHIFFEGLPPQEIVDCPIEHTDPELIFKEIFTLQQCAGICIGELHTDHSPKHLLYTLLPQLKAMGVNTLYLEHIKHDLMQQDLDDWFEGRTACLPIHVTQFLEDLDRKYGLCSPYSYTGLVARAKEVGIRIIGFDTQAAAIAGCHPNIPMNKEKRVLAINYQAKKIIEESKQGLFIVLTGVDHGSTLRHSKIPGISELIHCPFLIVSDSTEYKKPQVHLHPPSPIQLGYDNEEDTVHAVIVLENPPMDSQRRRSL
ncbi:MAG: hypothetical protein JSR39_00345 [Verrucomicrobia bacterium]|nr:hypothetical protein [Verrucomicrobiota bacterium]